MASDICWNNILGSVKIGICYELFILRIEKNMRTKKKKKECGHIISAGIFATEVFYKEFVVYLKIFNLPVYHLYKNSFKLMFSFMFSAPEI